MVCCHCILYHFPILSYIRKGSTSCDSRKWSRISPAASLRRAARERRCKKRINPQKSSHISVFEVAAAEPWKYYCLHQDPASNCSSALLGLRTWWRAWSRRDLARGRRESHSGTAHSLSSKDKTKTNQVQNQCLVESVSVKKEKRSDCVAH